MRPTRRKSSPARMNVPMPRIPGRPN
jgi:hypothetical protein